MGKEATSWDWLRNGINKTLPAFSLLERVENGVKAGTADVNYVIRGVEGWMELKAVQLPSRRNTRVLGDKGLNPDQINWHLARSQQLGRTFVFISAKPYRWLVRSMYAKEMNEWPVDDLCDNATMWYDADWSKKEWEILVDILGPKVGRTW